jgi:hypothetical protein
MSQVMDQLPGFVRLRGCFILNEKQPIEIRNAWVEYEKKRGSSYFPHPKDYPSSQWFLILEMADAGTELGKYAIKDDAEVWDIILSIIVALAIGEQEVEFEVSISRQNQHPLLIIQSIGICMKEMFV